MSADDFVFATLIAHHQDPAAASRALAMAEAAVLRRAADAINALPQDYECDPGRGDSAERLRRTADGIEEKSGRPGPVVVEAYDGELAMLRGLVRTLRTVVRADDADMAEVRRLLHHHASDDANARDQAEGKNSAADTAPGLTERQARLLAAVRTHGGEWNTRRVLGLFALTDPGVVQRGTARRDLETLQRAGYLALVDDPDNRHYVLHTPKGHRP